MKFVFAILFFVSAAHAANVLNCHTDAAKITEEKFQSFDMSMPMANNGIVESGGKLYINTFPPHPVEPNPFLKVTTEDIEVRDSLLGARGELIVYFSAGGTNYVLDVKRERSDKFVGVLRRPGGPRLSVEARCYSFQSL